MGFLDKLLKKAGPSWCKDCKNDTDIVLKQLYFMPRTVSSKMPEVGDYQYFLDNLKPVSSKKEIPTGFCAAGLKRYRCNSCSKTRDYIEVFVPVRDEERFMAGYHFTNGELNSIKIL